METSQTTNTVEIEALLALLAAIICRVLESEN